MKAIDLQFLTSDVDTQELCRQYWRLDEDGKFLHRIDSIANRFDIPRTRVLPLVVEGSVAFTELESCKTCAQLRPFLSRNDYVNRCRFNAPAWICQVCRDAEQALQQRQINMQKQQRWDVLHSELRNIRSLKDLSPETLTFTEAVYLAAVLRVGGSEDLSFVKPHDTFGAPLSPTVELDKDILDYLYRHHSLCIHPGSRAESIVIENGAFTSFFPLKVHWVLPLATGGPSPARLLEDLESLLASDSWPGHWASEIDDLRRLIALHECLQYLRISLEEHGFELRVGDKTRIVLTSALKNFSVAQVYNFIWRATRNAAAFYLREHTSKNHAANTVPGAIQRMAESALAEGWEVKAYRRDFRAPQSQVSHVLFTMALKLSEGGFSTVIREPNATGRDNHTSESPSHSVNELPSN